MNKAGRIALIGEECVACGCCASVCPRGAVRVDSGVTARVWEDRCVGCGRCAKICPAAVITMAERRAAE